MLIKIYVENSRDNYFLQKRERHCEEKLADLARVCLPRIGFSHQDLHRSQEINLALFARIIQYHVHHAIVLLSKESK